MAHNTTLPHSPDLTLLGSLAPQVLLDVLVVPTALLHPSGTIQALNTAWREMSDTGALCGADFPIGVDYPQRCAARDVLGASEVAHGIKAVLRGETARFTRVYPAQSSDGEHWYQLDVTAFPAMIPYGALVTHILLPQTETHISALQRASAHVEVQRAQLAGIIESAMDAIITVDADQRIILFNTAAEHVFRCSRADMLGQPLSQLIPERHRAAHDQHLHAFGGTHATPRAMGRPGTITARRATGEEFPIEASISQITVAGEQLFTIILRDVTERQQIEQALVEGEARFRQLAEHINAVFWLRDSVSMELLYISPAYERIWGRSCESLYAAPQSFMDSIHPDDIEQLEQAFAQQTTRGYQVEYRVLRPDGSMVWVHEIANPVRDPQGHIYRVAGIVSDITERRMLAEQLQQSQKLEGIGLLAGGIAHDFNNLLTAIVGYGELVNDSLAADDPRRADLGQILYGARRATDLTRQLLAFARKQVIAPRVVDLNACILDISKLLRRVIGEDIELSTLLAPDLAHVLIDPAQFEQVLMNLTVNARDAMPHGGKLTIETRNIELDDAYARQRVDVVPGHYIVVAVSDTGVGVARETLAHIFDPFFTTKEPGRGTGLGLAVCHGIITQAGGHIQVYSEPGHGAIVRIYLPQTNHAPAQEIRTEHGGNVRTGSETILLVEDEELIRDLIVQTLGKYGYTVLTAPDGAIALQLVEKHIDTIDLIITDVIMPGISGTQLAAQVAVQQPAIKILYISGYTEHTIFHHGVLEAGVAFLSKPFTPLVLVRKVREILDGEPIP